MTNHVSIEKAVVNEVSFQDIEELYRRTIELRPAFTEQNVVVAVFCSTEYLPAAATVIQSIIAHANSERNYDLIVVCSQFPKGTDAEKLYSMVKEITNFSLRIADGSPFIEILHKGLKEEDFRWSIDGECLRLYVPIVCRNYEKVVCLGADVLVMTDVAELYDVDLAGHSIAACSSYANTTFYQKLLKISKTHFEENVEKPWEYEDVNSRKMPMDVYAAKIGCTPDHPSFNGDVILLNIPLLSREEFVKNALNSLFKDKWRTLTEAVYNKFLISKCLYLPQTNNVIFLDQEELQTMTDSELYEYNEIIRNAKIFHFANSFFKPWRNLYAPHAEVWWMYACQTSFFKDLLRELVGIEAGNKYAEWRKMPSLKRKARLLSILRLFTFGKTRQRLKEKREKIRKRIETLEKT